MDGGGAIARGMPDLRSPANGGKLSREGDATRNTLPWPMTVHVNELERLKSALGSRYGIERKLARGGMATVYVATELHPHRTVAIKVFDPAVSARIGEARFQREIALAGKLTHPGIVPVYAAGEVDGLLYYVMPFVDGHIPGPAALFDPWILEMPTSSRSPGVGTVVIVCSSLRPLLLGGWS